MAGVKRQQSKNNSLKFQNFEATRSTSRGKKPLPEPTTVKHVFVMVIMHICRKVILYDPQIKVGVYLSALLFGSLVSDFMPVPRSYFSQRSNILNQLFVKWGWAWTIVCVSIYLGLTGYVYCCGLLPKLGRHFYRLAIGTACWFFWTKLFVVIEHYTAGCMNPKFTTKAICNKQGHVWTGFDISGHSFLLIYCGLLISEEAKSIRGWERIGELIRNEEFDEESPLKPLESEQLKHLQDHYDVITPYARLAFVVLTLLSILWDVMLVATILYFHHMVQKVLGGVIAILMWYVTYHWYYLFPFSPGLPGQGIFKYSDVTPSPRGTQIGRHQHNSQ